MKKRENTVVSVPLILLNIIEPIKKRKKKEVLKGITVKPGRFV